MAWRVVSFQGEMTLKQQYKRSYQHQLQFKILF